MNLNQQDLSLVVESCHSDLVIDVGKVTLGEENRKKLQKTQREQEKARIVRAACALLNSGGGVIRMQMANQDELPVEMGLDLEQSLRDLVQSLDFQTFFETKQQGRCFDIFVKSWSSGPWPDGSSMKPRICSLSSSLYCRSGTSVLPMNSREAFAFLKTKKKPAKTFGEEQPSKIMRQDLNHTDPAEQVFQKDRLEFGEVLPFPESQRIEFKQFSTQNILKYMKNIIPVYIPAFANSEGGYLFIGVKDDSKKVLGCPKDQADPASLKEVIKEAVSKLPHFHFCSSEGQVSYEAKVINVFSKGNLCSYLCAIKVEPFCCVLFSGKPCSWMVKDKKVCDLTTQEWLDMMMAADPDVQWLLKDFESQLSLSDGPPLSRPVYSRKGLEHKRDLQQRLFSVPPENLRYVPESLWKELTSQHGGLESLIKQQLERQSISRGILILSRSWAVDLNLPEKPGVLCDALLIAQGSAPTLYTVLGEPCVAGRDHCVHTAFTVKQKLVNVGGYTGKLCVRTGVLCLSPEGSAGSPEGPGSALEYPRSYRLQGITHVEALLQALVIVLLGFRSFLSDQLGCEILNLLTVQQYTILSKNLHKVRELFVHGLPGSGKTIMAVKIMEKIRNMFQCDKNDILYICENQPLRDFIGKKNICQAVTRKAFIQCEFPNIQHIIIDEAQNFRTENGDWYEKAKAITKREKDCPRILWIFLDYFQTSHRDVSGLPSLSAQYPREELTKVVRNANKIASYLKEVMLKIRNNPPSNIPRGSLMLLPEVDWVQDIQGTIEIKRYLTQKQLVTRIAETCKRLFDSGYSLKDVAILVSTEDKVKHYSDAILKEMRKKRSFDNLALDNARDVLGDHIVLDSVRRFSGLERNIVFGIQPKTAWPDIFNNILVCLASRAKQQLYILFHNG